VAAKAHVPFHGIFLVADLVKRLERIGARAADASDADAAVARQQERYALGDMNWTRIGASGTLEETLTRVRSAIGRLAPGQAQATQGPSRSAGSP